MTSHPTPTGESRSTQTGPTATDATSPDPASPEPAAPGRAYLDFARHAALILVALAALGYWPTRAQGGDGALAAMAAAFAAGLVASLAGTLPVWWMRHRHPTYSVPAHFGAMAVRLVVVAALGIAIAFSDLVPLRPFLLWLALGHAALLIADTLFARAITAHAMLHSTPPASSAATSSLTASSATETR